MHFVATQLSSGRNTLLDRLFERYPRSEALVAVLAYVQGVSTRRPALGLDRRIEGDHRGALRLQLLAAAISAINVKLDEGLAEFARRRLDEACPYLILDVRYERVREAGIIRSQAVLLGIGIGWDGRRSILAVERILDTTVLVRSPVGPPLTRVRVRAPG
jgi:transposase-like protein